MPAYVIAQIDVNDVDMYYEYASKIFETTKGIRREGFSRRTTRRCVRVRSRTCGRSWGSSRRWRRRVRGTSRMAYQAIIGLRQNSTTGHLFMVEGLTMPPDEKAGE